MNSKQAMGLSKKLALAFGAFLAVIEVFYNWEDPSWWPFILVDYIAVALLVYGALKSNVVLMAGWSFACAMFYMSFFMSFGIEQSTFVVFGKGVLLSITVAGLILALKGFDYDAAYRNIRRQ